MIPHQQQNQNILLILHNKKKRLVLSLHYNGSKNFLFFNATKIYQFKVKDSERKDYTLCLGDISKDLTISNMRKKKNKLFNENIT